MGEGEGMSNMNHPYQSSILGKRDCGQRFMVTYLDGLGKRRIYGFADDRDVAECYVDQIKRNPAWHGARIRDRGEA